MSRKRVNSVPAKWLLTEAEFLHLDEWGTEMQTSIPKRFNSAFSYHSFKVWHKNKYQYAEGSTGIEHSAKESSQSTSPGLTAAACKHPLHPVEKYAKAYCPVCQVEISL